jgi:muramoyltetrapeptide carboxypeptidase
MITPAYIEKGDKVAIVAPAGKIDKQKVDNAVKGLEKWGLEPVVGKNVFKTSNQYSATDRQRLSDFQKMLDDDDIRAIICARGGYGSIRIIDKIDFTKFRKNPKWIVGFSDITVLHSHIHSNLGIETIHGTMTGGFDAGGKSSLSTESLRTALFGEKLFYDLKPHPLSKKGKARGLLTGGNLAILTSLIGSKSDIDTDGKILFIEDVGEYLYRLDRMMWTMKRAGKLENPAGLIVGGMTDMKDNETSFGKTAYEIIKEAVKGRRYPVCFGFPAGYQDDNSALILGREIEMKVDGNGVRIW